MPGKKCLDTTTLPKSRRSRLSTFGHIHAGGSVVPGPDMLLAIEDNPHDASHPGDNEPLAKLGLKSFKHSE